MAEQILITGADGNLGSAAVKQLIADQHQLVLTVGPHANGNQFPEGNWTAHSIDLTDESATDTFIKEQLKIVDLSAAVLIVGGFAMGGFAETDGASLRKMYALNFETAYYCVRPLMAHFTQRGGGRFVLIGSRPALDPTAGKEMIAYALTKGMVAQLAAIINAEGADKNIVAAQVIPSTIDTPRNRAAMPDADFSDWVTADAIGETIRYFLSDAGKMLRDPLLKMYNKS